VDYRWPVIRIVIADDDLLVREGIEHMLAAEPEIDVVAVSKDRGELMAAIERESPDVVVTDIRMPPENASEGVEVAQALRQSSPQTGVIVVSHYVEPEYALGLLRDGTAGRGYLLKERLGNREQLVAAIKQVAGGGSVVDPEVVDALVRARSRDEHSRLDGLTPRERQVLAEVAAGKSNAAIARTLLITKRAVERHIGSIFAKLDLPREDASRRVVAALLFLSETEPVGESQPAGAVRPS
jgi:DNA-binding NarL/FixJ family response regulator